jgi:hypothetical protein
MLDQKDNLQQCFSISRSSNIHQFQKDLIFYPLMLDTLHILLTKQDNINGVLQIREDNNSSSY